MTRTPTIFLLGAVAAFGQPVLAQTDAEPQNGFWQNQYCINPSVPHMARLKPTEGEVSVLFDISAAGKPENIRIAAASSAKGGDRFAGAFARSVTQALERWEYFAYINEGVEAPRADVGLIFNFVAPGTNAKALSGNSCVTSVLPVPPSSAGDPSDPFVNLARCMPPFMPRGADKNQVSSQVNLIFSVTPKGKLTNVSLAPGQEENNFYKEARRALKGWRYNPFLKQGKPIARENIMLAVTFGNQPDGKVPACKHAPFGNSLKLNAARESKRCQVKFNDGVPVTNKECYQKD